MIKFIVTLAVYRHCLYLVERDDLNIGYVWGYSLLAHLVLLALGFREEKIK